MPNASHSYACTHCGRVDCKALGSTDCEEARKRFFEEQRKRIEEWSKLLPRRRTQ